MKKLSLILATTLLIGAVSASAAELTPVKGKIIKLARFVLSSQNEPSPVIGVVVRTEDRGVKEVAVKTSDEALVKMILATSANDKVTLYYETELVQIGRSSFSNGDVVKAIEIDRE